MSLNSMYPNLRCVSLWSSSHYLPEGRWREKTYPLLKPLGSCAIRLDTISPYAPNSLSKSCGVTSNSRFPTYTEFVGCKSIGGLEFGRVPSELSIPKPEAPVSAAAATAELTEDCSEASVEMGSSDAEVVLLL
jgi:hypothetical protein